MHKPVVYVVAGFLIILALIPWLLQLAQSRPLIPESLSQARSNYESVVGTAQITTRVAERSEKSQITVHVVRTVDTRELSSATAFVDAPIDATVEHNTTPTSFVEQPNAEPITELTEVSTSVALTPTAMQAGTVVETPRTGMQAITDIITESMITEQVQKDTEDNTVQELVVALMPTEVRATGKYVTATGIQQPLEILSNLEIEHENLIVRVTSIKVGEVDVTQDQRASLESKLNTSIYRLLPQRYVKSYQLGQGQVVVQSQKRK